MVKASGGVRLKPDATSRVKTSRGVRLEPDSTSGLRIVFFGTPDFAVPALQALHGSRHPIVGVVTQPDRTRGRGQRGQPGAVKQFAVKHGLPVLQPERLRDDAFLKALRQLNADLGVVAAYGKILTDAVLQIPRLGLINVHASLLPKYRGAAPVHRAVMASEPETGVTIMRVVKALDAGPMLSKVTRAIDPDETSSDVERSLAHLGARALVESVDALAMGSTLETPQDESLATYARKLEKTDGIVDWSRPARVIHDQIRGLHPWPHAYSDLGGERLILLRSQVDKDVNRDPAIEPGTIVEASGDRLIVHTGSGVLRLLTLQREGRRPVSAREFIAGRRIPPGSKFVRSTFS
jgi:methionyl-tRNA formyltransferase